MPIENLAEFILYIAPGYLAIKIIRWFFPTKDKDSFHEISLSIILGVVIISFLKWFDEYVLDFCLGSQLSGLPGIRFLLAIILSGIITGFLLSILRRFSNWLAEKINFLRWLSSGINMVWITINHPNNQNWAVVYLDDGSIYYGWISNYTYNPNTLDQDFLLSKAQRINQDYEVMYDIAGDGVYLNTRDIKKIEFHEYSEEEN